MKLLIIILFFLLLTTSSCVDAAAISEENLCPLSSCGNLSLITYPFRTQNTHPSDNCTYIDLHCDTSLNAPVVKFPYAGEFYVRYVTNYYYDNINPYIQLYDPGSCVMRRLMGDLNFSSSPFRAITYADYTLYTCPRSVERAIGDVISPIECLSNSTNIVVALLTLSTDYSFGYNCSVLGTWLLPVKDPSQFEFNANDDLYLTWNYTACAACEDKDQFGGAWRTHLNSICISTTSIALFVVFMIII